MLHPFRRVLALALYWQHPLIGALWIPLLLGFAAWVIGQLSSLAPIPRGNAGAAVGVMTICGIALFYIGMRLGCYIWARARYGAAVDTPGWTWALIDAARTATLVLLVALLLLAPLLGREGYPLIVLGHIDYWRWFIAGAAGALTALAVAVPAWALEKPPRRILPYVPQRPDLGP